MKRHHEERWSVKGTIADAVNALHQRFAELEPRRAEFVEADIKPYVQVLGVGTTDWFIGIEYEAWDSAEDVPEFLRTPMAWERAG